MSDLPRTFSSSDPGAPQLSGQPGALVAILDAVLVDGYGSGLDAKAPLGWTRAFTGTNKRAYRNDPGAYSGNYLRFDDSNAQFVLVDGYATMSNVDTGAERFDSVSTAWAKSNAASSAVRAWEIIGTARCVYLKLVYGTASNNAVTVFFGDLLTLGSADEWGFGYTLTGSSTYNNQSRLIYTNTAVMRTARDSSGTSVGANIFSSPSLLSTGQWGLQGFPYPLSTTGSILLSRATLRQGSAATSSPPRAVYPGLWVPEHGTFGWAHTDLADVPGFPSGTVLRPGRGVDANYVHFYIDITNAWVL